MLIKRRAFRALVVGCLFVFSVMGFTFASKEPKDAALPEAFLASYFVMLGQTSHLTVEQMGAAGGTVGMGTAPLKVAYSYWSDAWQAEQDYETFLASWQGTAHVKLLQIHAAGGRDGLHRFFIETEHIKAAGDPTRFGIFHYAGFFTVQPTDDGWRIAEGKLESENPVWQFGGHQPWRGDPVAVAAAYLRSNDLVPQGEGVLEWAQDDIATVQFHADDMAYRLDLVQRQDGMWQVIREALPSN